MPIVGWLTHTGCSEQILVVNQDVQTHLERDTELLSITDHARERRRVEVFRDVGCRVLLDIRREVEQGTFAQQRHDYLGVYRGGVGRRTAGQHGLELGLELRATRVELSLH